LWWQVVRLLQWLLIASAIVGGVWLALLAVLGYLQVHKPSTPDYHGVPVPTLLLVGGVVVGVVLAVLCRALTSWSARAKGRSADHRLRAAIGEVTDRIVIEPIEAEVEAYRTVRDGLAAALR
jgi:hypothetical protein